MISASVSGTWIMVSVPTSSEPKNAPMPTRPSSPTVAISTIEPFFMTVVIEATPPLGKTTSRMGSFRLWRTCVTLVGIRLR